MGKHRSPHPGPGADRPPRRPARAGRAGPCRDRKCLVELGHGTSRRSASLAPSGVDGDPVQPGWERGITAEVGRSPGADKGVLRHIRRHGPVGNQSHRQGEHLVLVEPDQVAKGVSIPLGARSTRRSTLDSTLSSCMGLPTIRRHFGEHNRSGDPLLAANRPANGASLPPAPRHLRRAGSAGRQRRSETEPRRRSGMSPWA